MRKKIITRKKKSSKTIFLSLSQKKNPRICVKRRLGGIGDVIMSLPSLKAIKKYYPNAYLVYATDTKYMNGALAKVVQHNPYADKVIHYKDVVDRGFDLIVDITSTGLSKEISKTVPKNRIDYFAEEVGIEVLEDPIPEYHTTQEERDRAKSFIEGNLKINADSKIVVIQTRSNDIRRTWPLEKTQALINMLAKDNTHVILCDWKKDFKWRLNENCTLYKEEEFDLTAAIIERADLVICPDSSILHIAGALQKPTLTIFGPIPPESRCNHYPSVKPIALRLRCSYCFYTPVCKKENPPYMDCLNRISVEKVYKEAIDLLNSDIKTMEKISYGSDLTKYNTDNIVLVKRSTPGIGDIIMAANGIEKIKKRFPGKELHVAVQKNLIDVLKNNPYIDDVFDVTEPINEKRYFAMLDISFPCAKYESTRLSLGKPVQKSRVEVFAEALGTREMLTDLKPKFYLSEEDIEYGKTYTRSLKTKKPIICVSLQSAESYRSYNKTEEVIKLLKFKGFFPIILDKSHTTDGILSCSDLSIREAAGVLYASNGLITVDTGWLHISAALGKKTLAIFGPIDYRARCKQYDDVKIIVPNFKCVPCWRNSGIKCKQNKTLKSSHCLESIQPSLIASSALEFFTE